MRHLYVPPTIGTLLLFSCPRKRVLDLRQMIESFHLGMLFSFEVPLEHMGDNFIRRFCHLGAHLWHLFQVGGILLVAFHDVVADVRRFRKGIYVLLIFERVYFFIAFICLLFGPRVFWTKGSYGADRSSIAETFLYFLYFLCQNTNIMSSLLCPTGWLVIPIEFIFLP